MVVTTDKKSAAGAEPLGYPCFKCGLMFANKQLCDQHAQLFHDPKYTSRNKVCDECGETTEELQQHMIDHDIGRIILALYLDITREKNGQGSILLPPAGAQASSEADASRGGSPRPSSPQSADENESMASSVSRSSRGARARPALRPPSVVSATPEVPAKKRGRPKRKLQVSPRSPRRSPTPSPRSVERPKAKKPRTTSPAVAGGGAAESIKGDKCMFCSESFAKPWELVGHMADNHNVELEHIIKGEVTDISEDSKKFNRPKCPYCGTINTSTHGCLMHILTDHRMPLFCSVQKGAQCTIVIGLVTVDDKHYTITIRVKPKK